MNQQCLLERRRKPPKTVAEYWPRSQEVYLFPGSAKAGLEKTGIAKSFGASYFHKKPILYNLIKSMFCYMIFFLFSSLCSHRKEPPYL